ncbi:MAG TPA: helix-turn-helix domain-containing protein [Gemmataceae bacterium]|nr:helix-turn-helix domain-containing protein [Gemmataceae bacterium]
MAAESRTAESYTVAHIAERYGVSSHTVLAWIDTGELQAVNVARSPRARRPTWRVTAEALAAFEALRSGGPVPPRASRRRRQPDGVIEFYH